MTKIRIVGSLGIALLSSTALAQTDGGPAPASTGVQDIIVTAQRKSERLQDVPISVNVVSGAQLATKGLVNTQDLPVLVPGLTFITTGGAGTAFLRGVGSNAGNPNDEPSVATYVDGVYIASSYTNMAALNNVERVEVLKGPQGTLFGRNATGGVIQIITRDPSHTPTMEMTGGYANYNTVSGSLYATTGITDTLAWNIAIQGSNQGDGWGRNIVRGDETYKQNNVSMRSKLLWEPTERLKIHLSGDYAKTLNHSPDYRLPDGVLGIDGSPPPSGKYDTQSIITTRGIGAPEVAVQQYGGSLQADYDADFGHLVSISAYRKNWGHYYAEPDTVPTPYEDVLMQVAQHNFSQEVQYISPKSWPFDLTVGGFYYRSTAGYPSATVNGLAVGSNGQVGSIALGGLQRIRSLSGYAQATVEILPKTKLTAGIRYTHERDNAVLFVQGAVLPQDATGYNKPTWRIALDHAFTNDIHAYVSYNRGVKGGGFNLLSPGSPSFNPEVLDAYEGGIKTQLFDHKLRFNAAYFLYDYKDIQVQVVPANGTGTVQQVNASAARIHGLDVDFELAPVPHLSLSGGFAYIMSKYKDYNNAVAYPASPLDPRPAFCSPAETTQCVFDASGNRTIRTPKFSGNLTLAYEVQSAFGRFPLSVTANHNSGFFFDAENRLKQNPYTLLNVNLGWISRDDRYAVSVWGRNLTNEYYLAQGVPSAFGDLVSPEAPRTYGVTFKVKFGG